MNSYRNSEKKRLIWILLGALIVGFITGYYWLSLVIFLGGLALWSLGKLLEIDTWIGQGATSEQSPYSSGLWGRIINHIIRLSTQVSIHKKRYHKLLARFNEVLRTFPYPTIAINANHEISWISKKAAKLLMLNRKKDVGLRINHIIRQESFSEMLAKPDYNEFQFTSPIDGESILVIGISPLNKDMRLLSIRDTSNARQLDKLKSIFIDNISNELHTPLTTINECLATLNTSKNLSHKEQEMVAKTYVQTQKIHKLVNTLLDFSNLDNQSNHIDITKIDINTLVQEVHQALPITLMSQQTIDYRIQAGFIFKGSQQQLKSMLSNLIENAVKYSHPQGNIDISWGVEDNKQAILRMTDTPNDAHPHRVDDPKLLRLTEPFYRLPQHTNITGIGLGLSIVSRIVKNHQGTITLHSTQTCGLCVTITLPVE